MSRTAQATLRTARLELVPLAPAHVEYAVALDSDPAVMRFLSNGALSRDEAAQRHAQRLASAGNVPGLGFWAGFAAGQFTGWWALEPAAGKGQAPPAAQAELGYRLLQRYWRQGLASEGARELVRHGFEDLRLDRIFAETMAVNIGSRATMASAGLRHVRSFHLDWNDPLPGSEQGEVEYALSRPDWLATRATG